MHVCRLCGLCLIVESIDTLCFGLATLTLSVNYLISMWAMIQLCKDTVVCTCKAAFV